jgi:hypothetical protein
VEIGIVSFMLDFTGHGKSEGSMSGVFVDAAVAWFFENL